MNIWLIFLLAAVIVILLILFFVNKAKAKRKISIKDRMSLDSILEGEVTIDDTDKKAETGLSADGKNQFQNPITRDEYNYDLLSGSSGINEVGLELMKEGKLEEAIEFFNGAINNNPADANLYYNRGLAKSRLNHLKGAIDDITDAMLRHLNNPESHYQRGKLWIKMGDKENALRDFIQYVSLNKSNAEAYFLKGVLEFEKDNFETAINDFNRTIELDKNYADAYFKRGMAKYRTGYEFGACKDLKAAFEKGNLEAYHYIKLYCK